MMFWKFRAVPSARIDELLNSESVTLDELLDEEDVIQECKAQNSQVVDFLTRPDVLTSLVDYLVTEPPTRSEITSQYRYASLACEVVACAIPAVLERLVSDRGLLDRLYALLLRPAPLNPLLASFLTRTLAALLVQRSNQLLEYLRNKETFVDLVLQHLGTSAIMDLLCHLVAGIESADERQTTLTWLSGQKLVERLALLVGDSDQPERQTNAALVLVTIVTSARQLALQQPPDEREDNPLLATIETVELVSSLVDAVLAGGRTESGLVNAVHVLLPLLDTAGASAAACGQRLQPLDSDEEPPPPPEPASVQPAAMALLARLPALHEALVSPPPRPDMVTSWGRLSPPLGATRLQLARLVSALLATNRHAVNALLARLNTVDVLLDLFFHFTLNNFLHSQVEQCVSHILESPPQETGEGNTSSHPLLEQLFTSSKLIQRILHGMEGRDTPAEKKCDQSRCCRSLRGYGGHLVNIANKVVAAAEQGPNSERLQQLIDQLPEDVSSAWRTFCETQLRRINELNRPSALPDVRHDSSNDSDFRAVSDAVTSQQAVLLKMMSEETAGAMAESLGRGVDAFRELSSGVGPLSSAGLLSLAADAEARPGAAELFEQQCADIRFRVSSAWPVNAMMAAAGAHSSSDEDEDDDDDDSRLRMEVDTSDPWAAAAPAAAPAAMDTNVWQSAPAADLSADRYWANFDAFASPSGRPPSPPLLPSPAAALGVSPDSQTSPGVAPPRPPGSGSPHFPVDFSSAAVFASSPEPAPMVSSPPRDEPAQPGPLTAPADTASERLTKDQSAALSAPDSSERSAGADTDCSGAAPSPAAVESTRPATAGPTASPPPPPPPSESPSEQQEAD